MMLRSCRNTVSLDLSRDLKYLGATMLSKVAIIAITTSNSINVKPGQLQLNFGRETLLNFLLSGSILIVDLEESLRIYVHHLS